MSDLAALLVAWPLVGSVAALLVGVARSETGWPVALVTTAGQAAMAAALAAAAFGAPVRYVVGGFTAPYGIELVVDGLSAGVAALVAVVSLGVLAYARAAGPRSNAFYATYLLLVAGLSGVTVTGDVFNMYVFLEITGVASYVLVASGDGGEAALAALKYLLVGTVGASLFLLGVGYAYVATGTLNMADLSTSLAAVGYDSPLVGASFGLVVAGLFIKTALFPLHTWQPDAYAGAPDAVSALISALVSTVGAYALLRVVFDVYTVAFLSANPVGRTVLVTAGAVSIVAGSVLAVSQRRVKRMLAYSSVSQFGLVVAAAGLLNATALTGAAIHLLGHAVMKGGLFLAVGLVGTATGARSVGGYDGLSERLPGPAGAVAVLAFAMVGVPPAVGFVGKWYVALGAVEAAAWPLAVVILASTLLTLAYFARLVERMYFRAPATPGGGPADGGEGDPAVAADGGDPAAVSTGMVFVVGAAAVLSVLLGLLAIEYAQALEPTVERLLSPP